MNYTQHPLSGTTVYAVCFADDRIKVGITKNFKQRMAAYKQEVKRNGIEFATAFGCVAFKDHSDALELERHICKQLQGQRINGQREWFYGQKETFKQLIDVIQNARVSWASPEEDKEAITWGGSTCCMKG